MQKGGTRILDVEGRLLTYRAKIPDWLKDVLPILAVEVKDFSLAHHYIQEDVVKSSEE